MAHDEPILSKLDRLDTILREMEEIRKGGRRSSSCASTPSTSDGHVSSLDDFSPRSMEKQCRPINAVVVETEVKGSLIHRLIRLEDRVLKMEEELAEEEKRKETKSKNKKGGLKQLVKHCVQGTKKKPFYYV